MVSAAKAAGGIVAAMLVPLGVVTTPFAADAQSIVNVPCDPSQLVTEITNANNAGSRILRLAPSCNYALTGSAGSGTRGLDGLPIITGDITLVGGPSTHITRAPSAPSFRIFEVATGASLTVQNIFISGGDAGASTGGGILNARGNVRLSHTTLTDNRADNGGAFSNDSGGFTVDSSLISGNAATGGGGGVGYNDGSLVVERSRVTGNNANNSGGGLYNGQGGRATVLRSTFDHNTAGSFGGGLFNAGDGRLVLGATLIQQNTANNGGGLFNAGIPEKVTRIRTIMRANNPNNCVGCF